MKAAVVGAGGFVGRHLTEALEAAGAGVRRVSSDSGLGFDLESGILRDDLPVDTGLGAVIYLSQSPHYRDLPTHAAHLWSVNVVSAIKAAQWARQCGARRFVYASTGNVYAPGFHPYVESDPVRRDDGYALSKVHAEEAMALFHSDMDVTCVRLFGAYGPGQRSKLVPRLIQAVLEGRPVRLQRHPTDAGDIGGLRVSLGYIDDVVAALVQVAVAGAPPLLNVAGSEACSIRHVTDTIGRHLGIEPRYEIHDIPRTGDLIADTTRLSGLMEQPFRAVATGLVPTIDELVSSLRVQ